MKTIYLSFSLALFSALLVSPQGFAASALPQGNPQAAGFLREGLKAFDAAMAAEVDKKEYAGIGTMTARHGKLIHTFFYGKRNLQTGAPLGPDSIVQLASMTKPITGVAMMMLYEEGKWKLDDPVSKYVPELVNADVLTGMDKDGKPTFEKVKRGPTMRELMSHTAGFGYDFIPRPIDKIYADAKLMDEPSLAAFVKKLGTMPLAYQPGEGWMYSFSVDVQGYIVEKLSGMPLDVFMKTRIFEPLGMTDTDFHVPAEKIDRLALRYTMGKKGLEFLPYKWEPTKNSPILLGGGGLYSTGNDYLRFMQMVLNGGELEGKRLLKPETVAMMHTNMVPQAVRDSGKWGTGFFVINDANSFGLDFGLYEKPVNAKQGKGTYWWAGAQGTWFWIDPVNDLVTVGIIQRRFPRPEPRIEDVARDRLYDALVKPEK